MDKLSVLHSNPEGIECVGSFLLVKDLGLYEAKTAGGIFLAQDSVMISKFQVVSVGPKAVEFLGTPIAAGDIILAHNNAWHFPLAGYRLMRHNDVYAVLGDE